MKPLLITLLILFFTIILLLLVWSLRKRRIIKKIHSMSTSDKEMLLNNLLEPFGFCYISKQDIFSTRLDAWQRDFGYTSLYDKSAIHFHMIFDNLPVYFNYQNKTWLLELWKGQYGISTGCEIGLYYADRILSPNEYPNTLFSCVPDTHMINMSITLYKDYLPLAKLSQKHWWLTVFSLGQFSKPSQLSATVILTFPSPEMAKIYADALQATGIALQEFTLYRNTVSFLYTQGTHTSGFFRRFRIGLAQLSNHFWCGIYNFLSRPFTLSLDKSLFLYYQIPFVFRKLFRIRRYRKRRKNK